MSWDLLIRGGEVVTPDGVRRADVAVENGTIVELAPELSGKSRETIDASDLHVFPGVIDPHVHFNEPGRTEWEGFETGSSALAAGGGTCFFDMPLNSSPPTLDGESFDLKLAAARANSYTDFALWGGLTPNNLDKLEVLADRGVVGLKAFMSNSGIDDFNASDDFTLYRGMRIAADLGLVVAVHAENDAITTGLAAQAAGERRQGAADYVHSRPIFAEYEAVTRAVEMARDVGCSLHIVHVSCLRAGMPVWMHMGEEGLSYETCPHYLVFAEDDLPRLGAAAKCAPPLRPRKDVNEWRRVLERDELPLVGSDHSPSPPHMKRDDDFFKVWGGVAGVQSTLGVMLDPEFSLPLAQVAKLTATRAADRFSIPSKGRVQVGSDADVTLIDLSRSYTLTRDMLLDRHKLSPYVGRKFHGVVRRTIVRGHTVFRDGKIVAGDFRGKLVTPTPEAEAAHA